MSFTPEPSMHMLGAIEFGNSHTPLEGSGLFVAEGNIRVVADPSPMNTLAKEVIEINTNNGWNVLKPEEWADTYKIPAILALIHTEVSEATEAFRHDNKENFIEELADVIIRVLDCAGGLGLDIDGAVRAKLEKNKTRSWRHGGKRV